MKPKKKTRSQLFEEVAGVHAISSTVNHEGDRRALEFRGFMSIFFPNFPEDKVDEAAREIREKHETRP